MLIKLTSVLNGFITIKNHPMRYNLMEYVRRHLWFCDTMFFFSIRQFISYTRNCFPRPLKRVVAGCQVFIISVPDKIHISRSLGKRTLRLLLLDYLPNVIERTKAEEKEKSNGGHLINPNALNLNFKARQFPFKVLKLCLARL